MNHRAHCNNRVNCRYRQISFGLRNEPATFKLALYIVLSGVRGQTGLIYLDTVIVFYQDEPHNVKDVDNILGPFREQEFH